MGRIRAALDTNVLVDVLTGPSRPSYLASATILQAAKDGLIQVFITTQSILDASYIVSRVHGPNSASFRSTVVSLSGFVNIECIDSFDLSHALAIASPDLEDDALFEHADAVGCNVFVTSDRQFPARSRETDILILSPEELVSRLRG